MRLLSFLCFLIWPVFTIPAHQQCGCPGQPAKGIVYLNKKAYYKGEVVTHTCDKGYYFKHDSQFLKSAQRACQDTGLWNGAIPACDYYDVISNASINLRGLSSITDEWDTTCAQVTLVHDKIMGITRKSSPKTAEITAFFKAANPGPIHIFVRLNVDLLARSQITMSVRVDNANECTRVSLQKSGISEFSSTCSLTNKADGHVVSLAFSTGSPESSLSICSFKALVRAAVGCEELECPAYGTVYRTTTSPNIARYYCDKGYEIVGELQRECGWSHSQNKNVWFGTAPICTPIQKHSDNLPIVQHACPVCPTKQSPDVNIKSVQCFPEFTLGAENRMADCNCLTNWTWKFNFSLPMTNEKMRESPILKNSTALLLTIIAVIVTIFNILYCFVRCLRKKLTQASARPQTEVNEQHIYQNQEVRVEPVVLPLKSLSRDGRNLPDSNGRCSSTTEQNTYAEIGEFSVFSTARSTTPQHLSKNKHPCIGVNKGGKALR